MREALSEIGPEADGLRVFFEIDCRDGSVSTPFVSTAEAPMDAAPGSGSRLNDGLIRLSLPPGALSKSCWVRFRAEISSLVDRLRVAATDDVSQAGAKRALEAIEFRIEAFDFPTEARIFHVDDFFKSCLFGLDANHRRTRPSALNAIALVVSLQGQRPLILDAYSTDSQLQDTGVVLESLIPEGDFLDEPIEAWLRSRRDYFRDCDSRWGRLAPALTRLAQAGHPAVRWAPSNRHSGHGGSRKLMIATCDDPSDCDFESAILQVGPESLAQWCQAGLDYPDELLGEAERLSFSLIQRQAQDSIAASGPHGSPDQIGAEIASLRQEIKDIESQIHGLQASHDALIDARHHRILSRYSSLIRGPGAYKTPEVRHNVAREMLIIARILYRSRVSTMSLQDAEIHGSLESYFHEPTGGNLRELMTAVKESRDEHANEVARVVRRILRDASAVNLNS